MQYSWFRMQKENGLFMDVIQDQPEEIVSLYNKAKEGYDIVLHKSSTSRHFAKRMGQYFTVYFIFIELSKTIPIGIYHLNY